MSKPTVSRASADEAILDLYFARDERAIAETENRYGKVCMQVSMGVLSSRSDAEECVSDTYLKAWNTIPPTWPQSLCAYLCRIVRNPSVNRLRDMNAARRSAVGNAYRNDVDGGADGNKTMARIRAQQHG